MYSIYVKIGKKVLEAFTKELGMIESLYKSPKLGDMLVPFTEQLQSNLRKENIVLPSVLYSYDPSLPDTSIRTIYGIHNDIYDKKSLESILRFIAGHYSSQDNPFELAQNGHDALQRGNYNAAMDYYDKAIYLLMNSDTNSDTREAQEILITVLYNVIYIHYANNRDTSEALRFAKRLLDIVEDDNFYDPVIRYEVHTLCAKLLWVNDEREDAVQYFKQAFLDIENAGHADLSVLALWNIISVCFDEEQEISPLCLLAFNKLVNIIQANPNLVSADRFKEILLLHNGLLIAQNQSLSQANAELMATVSKQQQIINEQARQLSTRNLVCSYVSTAGHLLLDVYALALPRNWNFVKVKNSIIDRGSTVAGITFRK